MSTTTLTMRSFRSTLRWSQFKHSLVEWRRRVHSRDELMGLSQGALRDIGLSRSEAHFEASKPFWMV
jgi:uncharacterized protein YjiS (DUF1127 family)